MRTASLFLLLILCTGCSGGEDAADAEPPPERTRAQRDSLLSTLPVPGAHGVGGALDAAGAAAERARRHDTIR